VWHNQLKFAVGTRCSFTTLKPHAPLASQTNRSGCQGSKIYASKHAHIAAGMLSSSVSALWQLQVRVPENQQLDLQQQKHSM